METKEYRLTDVCDFQGGTQPPKEEWITEPREGYVRMLQIRDFTQDKSEHIGYVKDTSKLNKCNEEDILIGRYGASVGKILTGHSGAYNVAIVKTIPNEEILSKNYLYYILTGKIFQDFILTIGARAAQAGFNKDDLTYFKLHLPSLQNQEKLVKVLKKSKMLIENRSKAIELADTFLINQFLKYFGSNSIYSNEFTIKTIGQVCNFKGGGTPSKSNLEYFKGDIPWVSPKDMKSLYINTSQDKITQEAVDESSTKIIPSGSVLMVVRSGILKSKLPVAINNVDVAINQDMKAFSSNKLNSSYLLYYFITQERNILKKVRATTADNFDFNDIKNLPIPIPPEHLQNKFYEISRQVEILKKSYSTSKLELFNLYNGLCQKALKGELEVMEKIYIEGSIKIEPKITGEVIAIDNINKELEKFHNDQQHTGAESEIDNRIRQLEAELKIKGEIPFWDEYVKYRIVKGKFKDSFTFDHLWQEITKFPFETLPEYDEVASIIFKWLEEEQPFLKQFFNKEKNQIELIVNEIA